MLWTNPKPYRCTNRALCTVLLVKPTCTRCPSKASAV